MPDRKSDTERAAGVSSCRLNPNIFEWGLTQNPSIGNAVERYSPGHTKTFYSSLLINEACHFKHHFLCDCLNTTRQIHFALRYCCFGLAWRALEHPVEELVGHTQTLRIIKVVLV